MTKTVDLQLDLDLVIQGQMTGYRMSARIFRRGAGRYGPGAELVGRPSYKLPQVIEVETYHIRAKTPGSPH